ncbi:hypothetical protein QFC21_004456 [Naganishia friedmannii]|uniref:Uncharacterized protein n=1 Tax=Naganishia friedmannii TaxID=89922 RepID=A0ACC2VGR3_9TREE|nr:hypothetical protein QFC21_004456 [Naganishia friedmannii]
MQRHQLGGIFLAIASTVLLSIATFSTPFSKEIYFVGAATSFGEVRFGGFGWCRYIDATTGSAGSKECWGPVFGYHWDPEVTVWLTRAEITIGIGEFVQARKSQLSAKGEKKATR